MLSFLHLFFSFFVRRFVYIFKQYKWRAQTCTGGLQFAIPSQKEMVQREIWKTGRLWSSRIIPELGEKIILWIEFQWKSCVQLLSAADYFLTLAKHTFDLIHKLGLKIFLLNYLLTKIHKWAKAPSRRRETHTFFPSWYYFGSSAVALYFLGAE